MNLFLQPPLLFAMNIIVFFTMKCWQQIDLSAFVANELSAFPEQMASGGPTLPFPFWTPSVFLVHHSQPTFSAHEKQPVSCPCTDGSAP